MKVLEFFKDNTGQFSSMRLMNLSVLFMFLSDYGLHIVRGVEFSPDFAIVGIIVGILGLKQIQNKTEKGVTLKE